MTDYDKLWEIMTDYNRLWWIMADYDRLWQIITDYDRIWQIMTDYEKLMADYDILWQIRIKFMQVAACSVNFFKTFITQPNEGRSSQNFRDKFLVVPQVHQQVKDDPILQVSCQDLSASSKYDFKDTLLFMLESRNLAHKSRITYHDDPWC